MVVTDISQPGEKLRGEGRRSLSGEGREEEGWRGAGGAGGGGGWWRPPWRRRWAWIRSWSWWRWVDGGFRGGGSPPPPPSPFAITSSLKAIAIILQHLGWLWLNSSRPLPVYNWQPSSSSTNRSTLNYILSYHTPPELVIIQAGKILLRLVASFAFVTTSPTW